jgi:hypothetical protein
MLQLRVQSLLILQAVTGTHEPEFKSAVGYLEVELDALDCGLLGTESYSRQKRRKVENELHALYKRSYISHIYISADVTPSRSQTSRRRDKSFSSHNGRHVTERLVEMLQYSQL